MARVPGVVTGLGSRIAPNNVLSALRRLEAIGAVRETPYAGRPAARMFARCDYPFWSFLDEVIALPPDATKVAHASEQADGSR